MATTADILGVNSRPAIPRRWARHYEQLCTERERLATRDCSVGESSPAKLDDLTDAGSEENIRDLLLVSAEATQANIQEVLDAIRRIERGLYGVCEITGLPIEPKRLLAIPWTRYSYAGQAQLEKDGIAQRLRLPDLRPAPELDSAKDTDEEETAD
jgi:RNA polymerase-binding transcription factor DksA